MTDGPEFSRPLRLDAVGEVTRRERIEADATERAALARRFGLVSLDQLAATFETRREAGAIRATGRIEAAAVQACVASGEPVAARVDEPFDLRFVPAEAIEAGAEVELDADACDLIPYSGAAIDLGEAAAETLALVLDPFPRGPGADAALAAAGVLDEAEAGPFAALRGLKDRLDRPN